MNFNFKILFLAIGALLNLQTAGQVNDSTILININGYVTKLTSQAAYYRVIEDYFSVKTQYKITQFTMDSIKYMEGYSLTKKGDNINGEAIWYYPSGKIKIINNYFKSNIVGERTEYYTNGILKEYGKYLTENGTVFDPGIDKVEPASYNQTYSIISFRDSTGKETLTNGTGTAIYYTNGIKTEEMNYENSKKSGACLRYFNTTGKIANEEEYKRGNLIRGVSYDTSGNVYSYTKAEEMPVYPGGEAEMMEFINDNVKYPKVAREQDIQGKVIVQFIVDRNGSVTNPKIIHGLSPECDSEVIRVLLLMPTWTPGKQLGIPVRVTYNVPVKFSMK